MKNRYRLITRGCRGGTFYCVDGSTGKRTSLGKCGQDEAEQIVLAKNQALRQPALNLQIARAYLGGASDAAIATRTWQYVMNEIPKLKRGDTQLRWLTAIKDRAFDSIRAVCLLETKPDHLLDVLKAGTVSTNVYLRRLHNFAVDMTWLPWPVLPKRCWPIRRRLGRAAERPMTPYDFRHLGIIHDLESMVGRHLKCGNFGHAQADLSVRIGHSCIAFTLAAYVGTAAFLMP